MHLLADLVNERNVGHLFLDRLILHKQWLLDVFNHFDRHLLISHDKFLHWDLDNLRDLFAHHDLLSKSNFLGRLLDYGFDWDNLFNNTVDIYDFVASLNSWNYFFPDLFGDLIFSDVDRMVFLDHFVYYFFD